MGLTEAIVTLIGGFLVLLGTLATVRGRGTPAPPAGDGKPAQPIKVTSEQIESARDPGIEALSIALSLNKRLEKLEEANARLVIQNKLLRRVLLEVADLLRKVPPISHDVILAHILERLPDLGEEQD